mgnify:CR=1 FL=1
MGYLLSADGGGTKTEFCVYHTETKENFYYKAGGSNYKSVGLEGLRETLQEGKRWLKEVLGIEPNQLEYAVFGMSGCDSREEHRLISEVIQETGYEMGKTYLCNDGELAFYAQAQAPGVVIIAGTGSVVIGIDEKGESKRVGGWGYGFSDIGSGYWIGNEAIKHTLLYCDGCRPCSDLCQAIRTFYGAKDFEEFPYLITQIQEYSVIAQSAAEVIRLARQGCRDAEEILLEGAEVLASQAASVCRKMKFQRKALSIVCSGGTIAEGHYRHILERKLREHLPEIELTVCQQKNTPSYGGIRLAEEKRKKQGLMIQIFTGGYQGKCARFLEIKEKLDLVLGRLPIRAIIIGWCTERKLYEQVRAYLKPWKIELYLWLPVFSETGLLKDAHLMRDYRERSVESFHLKEGENFEFYCPSDEQNQRNVIQIYEEYFDGLGFDGVFLDKIRYGAFSNGLSGVFSCFCEKCREKYAEFGLDTESLIGEMKQVEEGKQLLPRSYREGRYQFENPVWESFFDCKARILEEALKPITQYFKDRGMKVGMDLFAPFLGYFSGQQAKILAEQADFVKPMMYRMTNAPAGLPFEYRQFLKETARGREEEASRQFCKIVGIQEEKLDRFDLDFVKRELSSLTALGTKVYCGIEVNQIPEIAVVTPDEIEENLRELGETKISGFVLSWDLLSMPEENINGVISVMGG